MRALADAVARWRTPKPQPPQRGEEETPCVLCGSDTSTMQSYATLGVCSACNYHHAISAWQRIRILADGNSFREIHASTTSIDPLSFPEGGDYRDSLREAFRRTRLREAAITGVCKIQGRPTVLIILDFGFLGGSMGVVVGERVAQAFEYASNRGLPVVSVITSSGTRVQEGVLALMQMAKTSAAAGQHSRRRLTHVTILGNPSTGGVFASFANLADVIVGEPGALVGHATLRDVEEAERGELPPETHTAESHLAHGLIDQVVARGRQPDLLASLLDLTAPKPRLRIKRGLKLLDWHPSRAINPWQEVQLARHEGRPGALDYIGRIADTFVELRGDREAGDDSSVITGLADLGGQPVMLIGQERSRSEKRQPPLIRPEGFRKSLRAMRLAQKFKLPLVTLVDSQGADPSRDAEEHGLGHAIAENLAMLAGLRTPVIATIIGEGGGSGALAFAIADRVLMLEHSIFSVASPERAAAILYRDQSRAERLAKALRLTAADALELGVVDRVVREPRGGAHEDHDAAAAQLASAIREALGDVSNVPVRKLVRQRYQRYRKVGIYQSFFQVSLRRNLADLQDDMRGRFSQAFRKGMRGPRDRDEEAPGIAFD
ncbi:MAG: acetyl-CoA carboxylase carboxyl transferase subunit beta [Chloroflexi bacterium]|nr:acetyl-CoA carboxylase carboxyl transferase subunit beta [Chloroflexota bacterium]